MRWDGIWDMGWDEDPDDHLRQLLFNLKVRDVELLEQYGRPVYNITSKKRTRPPLE